MIRIRLYILIHLSISNIEFGIIMFNVIASFSQHDLDIVKKILTSRLKEKLSIKQKPKNTSMFTIGSY